MAKVMEADAKAQDFDLKILISFDDEEYAKEQETSMEDVLEKKGLKTTGAAKNKKEAGGKAIALMKRRALENSGIN